MGNLFLIFGKTDPGAIVTVNAEPADVEPDGSFKKTMTVNRDGSQRAHRQGRGRGGQ